ncbi:MAG TPA: ABC transporter permease [Vicinamibacterales bacterium]|nr:ABC transporter permease [Vicinamibacterales bacterium]
MTRTRRLLVVLIVFHIAIVVLPLLAPYAPDHQHRLYPLVPPSSLHVSGADGLYICALRPEERFGQYREDCAVRYRVNLLPISVDAPGVIFLMGTDELGRDVASQFFAGARQSLFAAEAAAALSLLIAAVIGTFGGYIGGMLDRLFVRAGDILMALPWLYAVLALRGALPLAVDAAAVNLMMIGLLALVGWVRPARVFRALVASTRSQPFVQAAVGFGAPARAIVMRHLLPAIAGAAFTQAALLIPQFLLAEVALSVLGVLGDSAAGWGPLVAVLQRYAIVSDAWWLTLPAVWIVGLFVFFHKLADAAQQHWRAAAARGSI